MLLSHPKTGVDLILMVLEGPGRSLDLCGEVRTMEAFRSQMQAPNLTAEFIRIIHDYKTVAQ